ncbi:hypothetical protein VNO77_21979 [Canavalia gladiata]|uniref:Uncharacterized protein n=1 Tax=Canavalia gladiata TaxID=3824 RepID=A0AAN9L2M1_CANGL
MSLDEMCSCNDKRFDMYVKDKDSNGKGFSYGNDFVSERIVGNKIQSICVHLEHFLELEDKSNSVSGPRNGTHRSFSLFCSGLAKMH